MNIVGLSTNRPRFRSVGAGFKPAPLSFRGVGQSLLCPSLPERILLWKDDEESQTSAEIRHCLP